MHISEGVLSPAVLAGGAFLTAAGVAAGLRGMNHERLMTTALLSAVFFVGSLVHVPIGPASAHLILNGLLGLFLGRAAFPAIFTALVLQAVLFQYGGIAILGVNTFSMAFPAVLFGYCLRPLLHRSAFWRALAGFFCGAFSVGGAALLVAVALGLSHEDFLLSAYVLLGAHAVVMVAEGVITALAVAFVSKVRPEVWEAMARN